MPGRPYQIVAREAVIAAHEARRRSGLVVLPTGTGKTYLASMLCEEMQARTGRRSLFVVHRSTLVHQTHEEFVAAGLDTTMEMGGHDARHHDALFGESGVVVASLQSLQGSRLASWPRDSFGLIVFDECHHSLAQSYRAIDDHFQDHFLLGITATPDRADKRSLGSLYEVKAFDYPIRRAIHGDGHGDPGGWLVPPLIRRVRVPIDLKGIRVSRAGDLNQDDLAERIGPHLESMARHILKHGAGRRGVVFTPDCGSAQGVAEVLCKVAQAPIAEYAAGSGGKFGMPGAEKDAILARHKAGEFPLLVSADLLFEGHNDPGIKLVVNMRPTLQRYRFAQEVGRGLRPAPGTGHHDCLVIDFDWQTDEAARDLALTVDLFDDDTYPEAVIDLARLIERSRCRNTDEEVVEIDPEQVIEEAKEVARVRARLDIRLTGAEIEYATTVLDPFGCGQMMGIKLSRQHDFDRRGTNPASDAQKRMLRGLGLTEVDALSKWGASKLIDKLVKRRDADMAHPTVVRDLLAAGVNPDIARGLTAPSARTALAEIAAANRIVPGLGAVETPKAKRKPKKEADPCLF